MLTFAKPPCEKKKNLRFDDGTYKKDKQIIYRHSKSKHNVIRLVFQTYRECNCLKKKSLYLCWLIFPLFFLL